MGRPKKQPVDTQVPTIEPQFAMGAYQVGELVTDDQVPQPDVKPESSYRTESVEVWDAYGKHINTYTGEEALDKATRVATKLGGSVRVNEVG